MSVTWGTWPNFALDRDLLGGRSFYNEDLPRLVDPTREPTFSTCTDVALLTYCCFDVNGYYRELGVDWRATKAEIFRAYQQKDGQSSERLTYIFKQLLNPQIRRNYDRCPLGSFYLDQYVADAMMRRMKRDIAAAGLDWTQGDILQRAARSVGLNLTDATPDEGLDEGSLECEDASTPESSQPAELPWPYTFYQYRSHCSDTIRLARWQALLVSAFSSVRDRRKISVGFFGRMERRWLVAEVGSRTVVYLHEDEDPTEEMATMVARQFNPSHIIRSIA